MKKALLFLLFLVSALQLHAADDGYEYGREYVGHGYVVIYRQDVAVDSIAVHGTYNIDHSKVGEDGIEHDDFVTLVVTTAEGEWRYTIDNDLKVYLPEMHPWERILLTGDINLIANKSSRKNIIFDGTFPKKDDSKIVYRWQSRDSVYIHMANQEEFYKAGMDRMTSDSTFALFKPIEVNKKEMPLYVYYPGQDAPDYNHVRITRNQTQYKVNNTEHIGHSGDCATSPTEQASIGSFTTSEEFADIKDKNIYTFKLKHHPAFFTFLTHNPRLPSIKLKSVTMVMETENKPIAGTFEFDYDNGIKLNTVEDGKDSITLYTPYFNDSGWKHTPRSLEHSQDSTAAYMVVAPQKGDNGGYLNFKFIFNVVDTLSLIDTTFVKKFKIKELKPNTFYTIDAEVPDTLFSIVDLGLGDIKYAFRNVESYFERGPVANYGGKFAYGESNTKNDYGPGAYLENYRGDVITKEFTENYDAAQQRWEQCWRMPTTFETDTLLAKCKTEWTEYNGVEGALVTGPSGKRIFLPIDENCNHYWSVDTTKKKKSDFYWIDGSGGWHFYKMPILGVQKKDSVLFHDQTEFHNPGFIRGVLEYSNDIRSNTSFDGTLMLLRHVGESFVGNDNFAINGIVRNVRPWPNVSTDAVFVESGFIFGTDSATLYFDEKNTTANKVWEDSMFVQDYRANGENMWLPKEGNHLKLVSSVKRVTPFGSTPHGPEETRLRVVLSGETFLGYLDKEQKYYVREYFVVKNGLTGANDYYYATKASRLRGYAPHTDKIDWLVGDSTATFYGHVVGVSSEVVGDVGFILSDSIKSETEFAEPTLSTGKFYKADAPGVGKDMRFKLTIGKGTDIPLENKYYFARAVFATCTAEDTTCVYACKSNGEPEVRILHPLDTVDLGFESGMLWANLDVRGQYPEDHDSSFVWNYVVKDSVVNRYVTDISGTIHDVTFNKWFGQKGWTFAMPTKAQINALMDSCKFSAETRFGEYVVKVTGINGNALYLPAISSGYHAHTPFWTSNRPWNNDKQAYWDGCKDPDHGKIKLALITNQLRVRPVLQTNCKIGGSPLFISTDTVGISNVNRRQMLFFGRLLGITPAIKEAHPAEREIERGFVLHDFKGGTHANHPSFFADMPDLEQDIDSINGLYTVPLPLEVSANMNSNTDYWYRAYIKIGGEYRYGVPKKLSPLTITIKDIDWEVHENSAKLYSELVGTIFIKNMETVETGFVYGKTAEIDTLTNVGRIPYVFDKSKNEEITDSVYSVIMPVEKDTIYWVRAYIRADGTVRYSSPRQFGLDYIDMGLPSHTLWANISVGSTYPEDSNKYYAMGEPETKAHYNGNTYIDDTLKYVTLNNCGTIQTTYTTKPVTLTVANHGGSESYSFSYHGAIHEPFDARRNNCVDPNFWKHYSGTRNDAAYSNWEYRNPLYVADKAKEPKERQYIDNSKYGDLFVEPNFAEWNELRDNCTWTLATENGVDGYLVTSNTNGNSIFIPLNGYRHSSLRCTNSGMEWDEYTDDVDVLAYFHAADTVALVRVDGTRQTKPTLSPLTDTYYDSSPYFGGHSVRPVARFTHGLSKETDKKLVDQTLAYIYTDTVTYLNYRTAVVLQGTYRINKPYADGTYRLGFVVGDRPDVEWETAIIKVKDGNDGTALTRNASQYFTVLDKNDQLTSDKTYYYRFFLEVDGEPFYSLNADTFRLAHQLTGRPDWEMYHNKATLHGIVQGVQPHESAGEQAYIIWGYDPKTLDWEHKQGELEVTDQLVNHVGPVQWENFELTKDTTYYFRTCVYYNNKYHYGMVNAFGFDLVDLGLPSKVRWASINLDGYNANTGAYIEAINQGYGVNDSQMAWSMPGSGGSNDDAHTQWKGAFRMPYNTEMEELMANTTWIPDTLYGCPGYRVTSNIEGYENKSIFLRHSMRYFNSENHDADYSLCGYTEAVDGKNPGLGYYLDIDKTNAGKKGKVNSWLNRNSQPGCHGIYFLRPVWECSDTLPGDNRDEILIRTDAAKIHKEVDNVSFFGSLLGITQQHMLINNGEPYRVATEENVTAGFIIGRDTLVTHNGTGKREMTYDFPQDIHSDAVYYHATKSINLFKVDSAYWVRAYVQINGAYYYGRSIKFVRQPNIITGDVDWRVGEVKATLYGNVNGFNSDSLIPEGETSDDDELKEMDILSKSARVGILVGFHNHLEYDPHDPNLYKYDLGAGVNGSFSVTVDYEKDTTYYYRAYIYYKDHYIYADSTNHFGLEFVDLGFKNHTHWASLSVGSRYAEDNDSLQQYAWGETEFEKGRKFTFDNYRYYFATGDEEYNNLGDEIKGSPNDVAHVRWDYKWDEAGYGGRGQLWSMPSEDDLQMLVDSCVWTDSVSHAYNPKTNTYDEVKGFKVTGPNGRYIFLSKVKLPEWTISGKHNDTGWNNGPWEYGALWTSSRAPRDRNAYGMEVGNRDDQMSRRLMKYHYRYHGHNVRPIAVLNACLSDGKKLSITTERTSWVAGAASSTIYGCVLGLNSSYAGEYGFVWSNTASDDTSLRINGAGVTQVVVKTGATVGGLFSTIIAPLDNTKMYYFRAYLKVNNQTFYGDIKEFGIVMVDLGLPSGTLWANVNMGSWKPKDHGDYYSWGETTTKDAFTENGYKYYNPSTGMYRDLGTDLSANDTTDVAQKRLSGLWRMPSDDEWQELLTAADYVVWKKDTVAHIPGYRVTSRVNGNSIFLPSNYYDETTRDANYEYETNEESEDYQNGVNHDDDVTERGFYWSSSRSSNHRQAREVRFDVAGDAGPQVLNNYRWRGNTIRPVASKSKIDGTVYDFYLRTEGTTWRYQRDSISFYSAVLNNTEQLETGFFLGTSPGVSSTNYDTLMIAKPSKEGSGNYVSIVEHNTRHDGVWYYRAYVKLANDTYVQADNVRQFGLASADLGFDGLLWANINVDAASPEQVGLNGTPTGKYAGIDPAYAEFGGLWRLPSEMEKRKLKEACTWSDTEDGRALTLYGSKVWKVSNKQDPSKFIYLTSDEPGEWGYRGVQQTNLPFDDGQKVYLRTDSTNWRAGYAGDELYATLVGSSDILSRITERGFVIGTTPDVTLNSAIACGNPVATESQIGSSAFAATMSQLPNGTHYYRAYVKYKDSNDNTEKVYYVEPSDAKMVGLEFIDLGLPSGVKWMNVNVGASVPSDAGDLYAWGDTRALSGSPAEATYVHHNDKGYVDIGADISNSQKYDVAAVRIDDARMPTQSEIDELLTTDKVVWQADTLDGQPGWRVTGKGDYAANSIFLPLGGDYNPTTKTTTYNGYWSSTQNTAVNSKAYYLSESLNNKNEMLKSKEQALRYLGKMVRPVSSMIATVDPANITTTGATLQGGVSVAADQRTDVGFEWSATSSMANSTRLRASDITFSEGTIGAFHADVTGLTSGNLYYYRAYVVLSSDGKTYYGTVKSFSTKSVEKKMPDAVDLGLTVKWSDRNVSAKLPELMGAYYAWGDTTWRASYSTTAYAHHHNDAYDNIGTNISASEWDIATRTYEGCWRMPTQAEMNELRTQCTWTWATKEGVQGYWVESNTNHQKIFLPAGGYEEENYYTEGVKQKDTDGYYWTANTTTGGDEKAVLLHFTASDKTVNNGRYRHWGYLVRPVYQSNAMLGEGSDAKDVYIQTNNISYADDRNTYTLYGTMLGLESPTDGLTQGFVIAATDNPAAITSANTAINVHQTATANGAYQLDVDSAALVDQLIVGQRYWVYAYVTDNTNTAYGLPMELKDYTFFTDSVKWGLGNAGRLYAHVKAQKPASGLTVGFRYTVDDCTIESATSRLITNPKVRNVVKDIVAVFNSEEPTAVFTAQIDTIGVHTYYYQAYTLLDGVYHYGEVKSFGARYVNLGLPSGVQWVDMNLGADNEYAHGDGYRWGETAPDQRGTYDVPLTVKYIGGTDYDAAHTRLGTKYRLPSIENVQELIDNCDWQWDITTNSWRVFKKNSLDERNSILLPGGSYWSSQQGAAADGDGRADSHRHDGTTYQTPDALEPRSSLLMLRPVYNPKGAKVDNAGNAGTGAIGGVGADGSE